jgi:hypothetical protein
MGQVETGTGEFAHKLEPGKEYCGFVLDALVGQTHYVEYEGAELAFFRSHELEGLPGEYRLVRVGDDEIEPCEHPSRQNGFAAPLRADI